MQSAISILRRQSEQGDILAQSAIALTADLDREAALAASAASSEGRADDLSPHAMWPGAPEDLHPFVFDLAVGDESAMRIERAAILLAALLFGDEANPDPALGLAVCAIRLGRTDEAYVFAMESLKRGAKHPRAFCIAGLCELENGDRNAAQQHLAVAARLARARTEFREDMRMAQRLLLILNFGGPRRAAIASRQIEAAGA